MTGPAASRRLGLTALAAAVGVLIVYLVLVRTSAGQQLDEAALDGRTQAHGIALRAAEDLLASITAGTLVLAVVALAVAALAGGRRRAALAAALSIGAAGAAVVTVALTVHDIGAVDWVDPDADFAGACVLVVAVAAASVAALLRARATA